MAAGMLPMWWLCLWAGLLTDNTLALGNCHLAHYVYDESADFCYSYDISNKEYTESMAVCDADTALLPIIHDYDTDNAVFLKMIGDTWLGLRFRDDHRAYLWDDGSPLDYEDWKIGEDDPQCVIMRNSNGKWRTQSNCNDNKKVLCLKRGLTAAACDFDEFDSASNICYEYNDQRDSWQNAYNSCDGFLAVITSEAENLIVKDIINADTWIGIKIEMTSTPYTWVDGTDVTYTKWDNNNPIEKKCVQMKNSDFGMWERTSCEDRKDTFCTREPACSEGYTYDVAKKRCHKYFSTASTWAAAQAQCVADGAHLPYIVDDDETDFNKDINSQHPTRYLWLGLQSVDTTPTWADGVVAGYLNWRSGELGNGRCAVMRNDTGRWITYNCAQHYNVYMCVMSNDYGCTSPWENHPSKPELCILLDTSVSDRWWPAHDFCSILSSGTGGLLRIRDQAENNAIQAYIQTRAPGLKIMIGVRYEPGSSISMYRDGSTATYTNWNSEEPATQGCATFRAQDGEWSRTTCDAKNSFTCMYTPRK